jgi:hypothetical protein
MAMGKWLRVSALLIPLAAPTAASAGPGPTLPSNEPTVQTAYPVEAPVATVRRLGDGWGLYATLQGRSMDLGARDWAENPHTQARDVEAGYGWRAGNTTALIGYDQHDYGPRLQRTGSHTQRDPNEPPPVNSPGVLGFSLVLHGR